MGETQTSHNWRGNETFSKPRPFRDEVIDVALLRLLGLLGGRLLDGGHFFFFPFGSRMAVFVVYIYIYIIHAIYLP